MALARCAGRLLLRGEEGATAALGLLLLPQRLGLLRLLRLVGQPERRLLRPGGGLLQQNSCGMRATIRPASIRSDRAPPRPRMMLGGV